MDTQPKKHLALVPLVLSLASCAGYQTTVQLGGKQRKCYFPSGQSLSVDAGVLSNGVYVGARLEESRQKSSVSLGYDPLNKALTIKKGTLGLAANPQQIGLNINRFVVLPQTGRVGTTFFTFGPGGIKLASPYVLPFYLFSRKGEIIQVVGHLGTEEGNRSAYALTKSIFLGDVLPFYPLEDWYYTTKRIFRVGTPAEGENLEEVLAKIIQARSNQEKLSLLESNTEKYPQLRGLFKKWYDSLLSEESFLIFKRDIANPGSNTQLAIKQNLSASQSDLEKMVQEGISTQTYWRYLTSLFYVSGLSDTVFSLQADTEKCKIKLEGRYLFLADDFSTYDIFTRFVALARNYRQEGRGKILDRHSAYLRKIHHNLEEKDYSRFRRNFENLYYSYHYWQEIERNFSPENIQRLSDYLNSRGRTRIAKSVQSLLSRPSPALDFTRPLKYLAGLYDLVKKQTYPVRDVCSLEQFEESYLDLRKVVSAYYQLRRQAVKSGKNPVFPGESRFYNQIKKHYEILLKEHLQKYPSEVNYHWHQARKDYAQASAFFWDQISDLNEEHQLGYSPSRLSRLKEGASSVSLKETKRFYHVFRKKHQPVVGLPATLKLDSLLNRLEDSSQCSLIVQSLGYIPQAKSRCDFPL